MGFLILARNGFCSLMMCWLLLVPVGVPVLVSLLLSLGKGVLFQHYLLIPPGSGWDSAACLPSSFFWCRCLSRFFCLLFFFRKGVLFHYNLLKLPGFPTLVSVLLSSLVRCLSPFFFFSSGKGFCVIMI